MSKGLDFSSDKFKKKKGMREELNDVLKILKQAGLTKVCER